MKNTSLLTFKSYIILHNMIVIIRNIFKKSKNYKLKVFVISEGYSVKNAIMSVLTMTTKIISRSSKNLISRFPK